MLSFYLPNKTISSLEEIADECLDMKDYEIKYLIFNSIHPDVKIIFTIKTSDDLLINFQACQFIYKSKMPDYMFDFNADANWTYLVPGIKIDDLIIECLKINNKVYWYLSVSENDLFRYASDKLKWLILFNIDEFKLSK